MKKSTKTYALYNLVSLMIIIVLIIPISGGSDPFRENRKRSYIVQGSDVNEVIKLVKLNRGTITSRLDIINGVGALLPPDVLFDLINHPGIENIIPNAEVKVATSEVPEVDYPDAVGADITWADGVVGNNVTVAVVDSGIDKLKSLRQDLDGDNGHITGWADFVGNSNKPKDENGHGTHVAGIIANTQIGSDQEWNSIAPGVNLVGVRVLDEHGVGTYEQVIQGIQWIVNNKEAYNIRVMNLSLVSIALSPYWADPLNQAVTQAWAEGIVVVVAAGNGGPDPMTIGVPGNNPYVITVGAFTDNYTPNDWNDDYITPFSAAGPTLDGFVKPDIVAPGAHLSSLMKSNSQLANEYPETYVSKNYFSIAGTSQAAAVVSGITALMLSRNADLSPAEVKYRLTHTAFPWVDPISTEAFYSVWQQGAGRVNAYDAVYTDIEGFANHGLDIEADLNGAHYQGFSFYDETSGKFRLYGDFYDWEGGYFSWDGGYGMWSGGYGMWSGGYGMWSGGYGMWSGGYGMWSGGYGMWSGGYGMWSGGYGMWSGGYGMWSGGYGMWSGSEPWIGTLYAEPAFVNGFIFGAHPYDLTMSTSIGLWVGQY